jgi:CDP-paratose 2-epimerase
VTERPSVLITGGAGFIGVNVAIRLLRAGHRVVVLDDLSRPGSDCNAAWLARAHPDCVEVVRGSLADARCLDRAVAGRRAVVHLAAQVAVTRSLDDPVADFEVNARGTLNLLEAARRSAPEAAFLYASTNKVYGRLEGRDQPVSETAPVDPDTPYACSKACADQYVRDYHRTFGLPTVVFRQSCIYGPHQNGSEDQGWVAHFVRAVLDGRPLTIYGDGRQVRDLLDVSDLADLYHLAIERIERAAGRIFNIGGGPERASDLLSVIDRIELATGCPATVRFGPERTGDQRFFVCDLSLVRAVLGWRPTHDLESGLRRLVAWARGGAAPELVPDSNREPSAASAGAT